MPPCNAPNRNSQGFTIVETLTVVIIVGILSALAVPSFLAMFNTNKINDALNQVRGALQEAQREAIRNSRSSCVVTLNTVSKKITSPCLLTGDRTLPDGVEMANNIVGTITFSIRGNVMFNVNTSGSSTDTTTGKIILYQPGGSNLDMKCVAISSGIGIIRTGVYSGPTANGVNITDTGNCSAS